MLPSLLLAGLALRLVAVEEPVHDVHVVDLDRDGEEDIVAVTRKNLLLLHGGKGPLLRRPVAPLTIVGRGRIGVVREGRYRVVSDPFGAWTEGTAGPRSLLAGLGRSEPALLRAPGDLDGDGIDDAVLTRRDGFWTAAGVVPVRPRALLQIRRNENFSVQYEIPVPVVGRWSGADLELVFFSRGEIVSFRGPKETDRMRLPLPTTPKEAEGLRRNHVLLEDVDGDGRLDLLIVMAKGKAGLFSAFEATALYFPGGQIFDRKEGKFHRPRSRLKVAGALLAPELRDLDGDGDLDLVLATVEVSLLASATGSAPGVYHLFRFEDGGFLRNPAWTYRAPVPLSTFTENPRPPAVFLPDLDRDGLPEGLLVGDPVRLFEANEAGAFTVAASREFESPGRTAVGRQRAALAGARGILVAEASR